MLAWLSGALNVR